MAEIVEFPDDKPSLQFLDLPPPGWFVLGVMKKDSRGWDWVALMVDVDPDEIRTKGRTFRECWVPVPGKHRNLVSALNAFEELSATRH
jgi:hypothetical protein